MAWFTSPDNLLRAAQRGQQFWAVGQRGDTFCATSKASLLSLFRRCRSISSSRGLGSLGLASMARFSRPATSSFAPPLDNGQLRQRQQRLDVLRVLRQQALEALLRVVGLLVGHVQRRQAGRGGKVARVDAQRLLEALACAGLSFCASWTRPRRLAASGLSGCLASSLSIAASALSNSRCAGAR